jgi:hypothetical protein
MMWHVCKNDKWIVMPVVVVIKPKCAQGPQGRLVNQVGDSGWGFGVCILKDFPGDAVVDTSWLDNHCTRKILDTVWGSFRRPSKDWVWWFSPVILELENWVKASLDYIANSRPVWDKVKTLSQKTKTWECGLVMEFLSSICKALGSIPSTAKKICNIHVQRFLVCFS